jgi:hypothetical protein
MPPSNPAKVPANVSPLVNVRLSSRTDGFAMRLKGSAAFWTGGGGFGGGDCDP